MQLREVVASIPHRAAAGPAANINIEELECDAPDPLLESAHPTRSATSEQDPNDDCIESLRRVVHNMKTSVDSVPETSEVRVGYIHIQAGFCEVMLTFFTASPLRKHCLASHGFGAQRTGTTIPILPCDVR